VRVVRLSLPRGLCLQNCYGSRIIEQIEPA
jgi:hypothetical protein